VISEQGEDLTRARMASEERLLEHWNAVLLDLEAAAGRRDEGDVGARKGAPDLGRQTDGSRLVISDRAVLDRDAHG
jgi:hypothetical protein